MRRFVHRFRQAWLAAWWIAAAACASRVPHPPYAAQPQDALVEVVAPPPPGRVEVVPDKPKAGAVWIDGEWTWRRRRWAWTAGRWVIAPKDAAFCPWVFERGVDGRYWYAPGAWRGAKGAVVSPPEPLVSAKVDSAAVVNASGVTEATGITVRPGASAPQSVRPPPNATRDGGR